MRWALRVPRLWMVLQSSKRPVSTGSSEVVGWHSWIPILKGAHPARPKHFIPVFRRVCSKKGCLLSLLILHYVILQLTPSCGQYVHFLHVPCDTNIYYIFIGPSSCTRTCRSRSTAPACSWCGWIPHFLLWHPWHRPVLQEPFWRWFVLLCFQRLRDRNKNFAVLVL